MPSTDANPETMDRAVRALFDFVDGPGETDYTADYTAEDIAEAGNAVATIVRVIRDDLTIARWDEKIGDLEEAEEFLNARIRSLTGSETTTGDTTVPGFAGYR